MQRRSHVEHHGGMGGLVIWVDYSDAIQPWSSASGAIQEPVRKRAGLKSGGSTGQAHARAEALNQLNSPNA